MNTLKSAGAALFLAVAVAVALASAAASSQVPPGPPSAREPSANLPTPTIPPATIDDTLEVTGAELDAEQHRSRMFVAVDVNGQGPFRFLVDSGADRSVIGAALAKRLALPPGDPVNLQGMAGAARVETVVVDNLKLGSNVSAGVHAPALPERFLGAQGLIGIDALADARLMVDFDAKTVTVADPRTPEPSLPGEIVVTARRRHGQLILTQASVAGIRVSAVIDTGAEITTGNSALEARIFRGRHPPPLQPITLISVTGQSIVASLIVLPELRIGNITLQNVPVAFVDAPPFKLFGLATQPALLLGTDVLQSFRRVSLDFRARKVRFSLRRGQL
jgi:predicted aspartyl protease